MLSCYFTKLEKEALLHIEGPDAVTFLQGQVTCDTRQLSPDRALPGLYCTVQGRVLCDFLLCTPGPGHLMLRLRDELRAPAAAVFARYIVFSKAKLAAERDDWQVAACWGPEAAAVVEEVFGGPPRERYASCGGDGFMVVQVDAAGQQFECYLGPAADELTARLQARAQPGSDSLWQAQQIASGIARVEAATSGEFVPQLLNYDLTGHISFKKGCYTGQEVVARLHYRGKPKRRLYLANLAADSQIRPGDALYSEATTGAVGNVINCAQCDNGEQLLLVTAARDAVTGGLRLGEPSGPALHLDDLPYAVPA